MHRVGLLFLVLFFFKIDLNSMNTSTFIQRYSIDDVNLTEIMLSFVINFQKSDDSFVDTYRRLIEKDSYFVTVRSLCINFYNQRFKEGLILDDQHASVYVRIDRMYCGLYDYDELVQACAFFCIMQDLVNMYEQLEKQETITVLPNENCFVMLKKLKKINDILISAFLKEQKFFNFLSDIIGLFNNQLGSFVFGAIRSLILEIQGKAEVDYFSNRKEEEKMQFNGFVVIDVAAR